MAYGARRVPLAVDTPSCQMKRSAVVAQFLRRIPIGGGAGGQDGSWSPNARSSSA